MKQKPWDRYEAALLLSYCLKIEAGDIPRKEAVDIVSNTLRKRAEVQGVEIDETFRNTNGISMQMSAIRNCYLGKDHGLAGSKLFHEMVDLYKSNHDALEQILQGESDKVNRSIWQEFLLWLKEAVPDKEKEIVTSLAAVSMLALKSNRTHMPISEISDVAEIERLQSIMRKPGALGLHSKKMLTKASHALNTYVQFLDKKADDAAAPEESQSVSVEESVAHANFRVDFSKSISYAHTKPISCKYKGRDISCAGWNALFINLTRLIYQECGDTFPVGCSLLSSSRIDIGNAEGMNYPKEIANGVYLECNASATGIVNKLHALFDICGINYDDVIIEYCKTSDNIVSEKEVKASNPQVAALEKLLSKHYKYGFRLGSPIELMRIRNFAEEDGIFLADSDEELERKIAATGIKIDGKVFIIESEILSGIAAVTDSVFDEGATVIFLNQLMEIKEEWLSEQHITNVDMLKTLLKRIRPNYYYGQNIITPGEKSTEHDAIVKEILRISTGQSVVRTDALKEKLPYIPTEKIAWSLSTSPEFIWISEGKYFLMNQFVLSEEDANTISEHVANECELNGYASITDLPLGNIQEENYELSETAIYAAVYSTVLKEHYYLHGKILTKEENGVDISALLKAYCAGKSCCTASELMERAEELTGTPNKQTSMAILYDNVLFHTDAVQAVGHIPIDVNELGIDMLSSSAHKFNGPKGIGFLYIRKGTQIRPLADGGAQEFHMRAGTENIASIVGMAVALKKNCRTMQETSTKLQAMDHAFIDVLHEANVDFIRNGSVSKSPGIISVSIRNISGEMLLHRLDLKGISISTGSACDSVNTQVSHVIKAIGVPSAYAQGTIRISFGHDNQIEDAVEIAHAIAKILQT